MQIPLKPRDLGELLGATFRVTMQHIVPLFVLSVIVNLPNLGWQLLGAAIAPAESDVDVLRRVVAGVGLFLTSIIVPVVGGAVATMIVAQSFTGDRTSLGTAIQVAMRRFLPLLLFSFAFALVFGLGLILLIIPGVYLALRYFVSSPALVLEGLTVGQAFGRSAGLTKGRILALAGFAIVVYLVIMVPTFVAAFVSVLVETARTGEVPETDSFMMLAVQWVGSVVGGTLWPVVPVVAYFDLRTRKEAFDVDQLASLVDTLGSQDR